MKANKTQKDRTLDNFHKQDLSNFEIQLAKISDVDEIHQFLVKKIRETYSHYPNKEIENWLKSDFKLDDIKYKYDKGEFFIIKEKQSILGRTTEKIIATSFIADYKYINFDSFNNQNSIYFGGLYIDKKFRNKGLGGKLIERRLERINDYEHNYSNIVLSVAANNIKVQTLMHKYGFKDYYLHTKDKLTPSIDWLYMLKDL